MKPMPLRDVIEAVGGNAAADVDDRLVGPDVVIDSRQATPGALFVAFPGEHVDGHDYIAAAAQKGAVATLCQRVPEGLDPQVAAGCIVVDDPTAALGRLARAVIDSLPNLTVVGITGSQGKTSTKDVLARVLAADGLTVAPEGSHNNEIGVPLTATRSDPNTRFLVCEMGARGIGHIAYLCGLTPPTVGVELNVGQAHVGEFGSRDAIAEAKGELVEALPADGWAVLNGTDARVTAMAGRTSARIALFAAGGRPDQPADLRVWASDAEADDLDRHSFTLHVERDGAPVQTARVALGLVGRHQVANATAAAATALAVGMELEAVATALSAAVVRSRWRMEVHERSDGVVVVNDAYNANPDSTIAACETLAAMVRRRRRARPGVEGWAVLGDMLELGDVSASEHEAVGRAAGSLQIDHVIGVGEYAEALVRGAAAAGCDNVAVARETTDAIDLIRPRPGDIVLVKASRAIGLERVADALLTGAGDPDRTPTGRAGKTRGEVDR